MRTFLIGMCDVFLILYLTAITNLQPATFLTVDDFYELKAMHKTLQDDKQKAEESLKAKLRREQEEKESLRAEKQRQEEEAAARLKALAEEKQDLQADLVEGQGQLQEMEQSLLSVDAEREQINKELEEKLNLLKAREKMLADLNAEIVDQEEKQRRIEAAYQQELDVQKETIETGRELTKKLQGEVLQARLETQITQKQALEEQAEADRKAAELLAAQRRAEEDKQNALEAMQAAQASSKRAQQSIRMLSAAVTEMKQDADTAYGDNVRSLLQTLNVTYEREIANGITRYERQLALLPVVIGEQAYVVFPSRQVGFSWRSDKAPDGLVIMYQDKKITQGLINKEDDLIAIALPGYDGDIYAPYSADAKLEELMPTLLSLRNNGSVNFLDKVRGISDDYFIVNRDYLEVDEGRGLKYDVKGIPGTGTRAERIIDGDQLVDLNGKLIGVAKQANRIVFINQIREWEEIAF